MKVKSLGIFLSILVFPITIVCQISYTCASSYTQNFDFLTAANFALTNNTPPGIYAEMQSGNASPNTILADAGATAVPSGLRNYGAAGNADRAFGGIAGPASDTIFYGVRIQNDCGVTATGISIQYTGEQWRSAVVAAGQVVTFSYQVNAGNITDLQTGTYTNFPGLDFNSPNLTNAGAIDGNAAGNQVAENQTITVSIPAGSEIMLRWTDINDTGGDHGSGIDNLTVTLLVPTAAPVTISGRAMTEGGMGISNATIVLSGGDLATPLVTRTNVFGYYHIDGVPAGGTYVLEIVSKRYSFPQATQVVNANDNVSEVNFIAEGK